MPIPAYILAALLGYLLGSVPTGYLVAKAKGVDIRTMGSGNIGATNVVRQFGKTAGAVVLLADAVKGWLSVVVAAKLVWIWFGAGDATSRECLEIIAGAAGIIGHNYTFWLGFKGGKGIATSAGVLAALVPWSLVIGVSAWILVFAATRYVSLASIAAALSLPLSTWITGQSLTLILTTAGMTLLAIYKHKGNIQRLMAGTESRFGRKASAEPKPPNPSS